MVDVNALEINRVWLGTVEVKGRWICDQQVRLLADELSDTRVSVIRQYNLVPA